MGFASTSHKWDSGNGMFCYFDYILQVIIRKHFVVGLTNFKLNQIQIWNWPDSGLQFVRWFAVFTVMLCIKLIERFVQLKCVLQRFIRWFLEFVFKESLKSQNCIYNLVNSLRVNNWYNILVICFKLNITERMTVCQEYSLSNIGYYRNQNSISYEQETEHSFVDLVSVEPELDWILKFWFQNCNA
jgi:hypothetical protein